MALTAAELVAYLRLDKGDFDSGMGKAEGRMRKSEGKFRSWAGGMGRAAAETVTAGATAAAGLAGAVFTTGVNYNTLQQRSRAALETLLDGSEKANEQMDKLDDFASNSPFAKDVFIQAQQQLLGFGTEAEDVIPILGAVEDSVAAVGGSNQDIAEIVNIFADIQGTGKITGETLRRLGTRGIDAATIIGDEMGKSGATIREEITSGSLDAGDAVAALTDGMTERFGGAAANVKETATGAFDRIRAATRDIGGEMARPFVDPKGGGLIIDWANDFADVLRALEDQMPGMVSALESKLTPAFDTFRITLKDSATAVENWDTSSFESNLDKIGQHLPAIAGLSGALFTLGTQNVPVIGRLTGALGPLPAALGAAALASPEMRDGLKAIYDSATPLIGVMGDFAGLASGVLTSALEVTGDALGVVADVIGPVVEWFADLPEPIRNAATAAVLFNTAGGPMKDVLGNITSGVGDAISGIGGWAGAFEGAFDSTDDFSAAVSLASESIGTGVTKGLRGAVDGVMGMFGGPWGIALMGATALITAYAQEQREAKARVDDFANSLDEQTGAITASSEEIAEKAIQDALGSDALKDYNISLADSTDAILGNDEALDRLMENGDLAESRIGFWEGAWNSLKGEQSENKTVGGELYDVIMEQRVALEAAEEATRLSIEAEKERYLALDEGERSNHRYKESIKEVTDETINMSDRVKALNDALAELEGGTKTQEERDRELSTTQRDLNSWFKENADDIAAMDENLIDMSTGMPGHTELGDQLEGMLSRMSDSAHASALEIYDLAEAEGWSTQKTQEAITEAYEPYIATLQDLKDQGYLTGEEVDALTDSIIGVPKVTAFAITHGDTVTVAELEVLELIDKIEATPDKDFEISDKDTSQEAMDILEDLGYDIRTIEDGEFTVTPVGISKAEKIVDNFVNKDRQTTVTVKVDTSGARKGLQMLDTGQSSSSGKFIRKHDGAIDRFKGMADGGVTGPNAGNTMKIAEMVAPGDIRFAGDRSDVDEAWIPLDGSKRSVSILEEAMRRMPNYAAPDMEGQRAGGISGEVTMPSVEKVQGPDTSDLVEIWQNAMSELEETTDSSFEAIQQDSLASQKLMESQVSDSGSKMVEGTTASQKLMEGQVSDSGSKMVTGTTASQSAMEDRVLAAGSAMSSGVSKTQGQMADNVASSGRRMQSETTNKQREMTKVTQDQLSNRRTTTAAQNAAMSQNTRDNLSSMRSNMADQMSQMSQNSQVNFRTMQTQTVASAAQMRSGATREFTSMKSQGVSTTAQLRSGIVSEMDKAKPPFTGKINDLIGVLRDFSSALNSAYGDMGLDIGKPTRLASGGILSGYTPGRDVHKFISPTGGQLHLSGGEAIMRPEVPRALGAGWVNSVNAAARSGGVSGVRNLMAGQTQAFADGGIFDAEFSDPARDVGREFKKKLPQNYLKPVGRNVIDDVVSGIGDYMAEMLSGDGAWDVRPTKGRITSTYGASRGRYPHAGMDVAKRHGEPTVSPAAGVVRETGWNIGPGRSGIGLAIEHAAKLFTYMGHNPVGGLRVKAGDLVKPNQRVGAQGNTGNSTGAHAHIEAHQGKLWNDVDPMPYWLSAGSGKVMGSGGSDRWSGVVKMALAKNRLPTSPAYVNAWLRQIQTESGGNPNARQGIVDINSILGRPAQGLLQVIPPTFAAHKHGGHGNIYNPLDNALAAMAYAKSRYGVSGMLNAIGRGRGYRLGTNYARAGISLVGEDGPEAVAFGGGEKVFTNRETKNIFGGGSAMTQREADMIGKAMAKHVPAGGNLVLDGPVTRDTDELARTAMKTYQRTLTMLGRG